MDLYLGYRGTVRKLSYGISDYSYVYEKAGFNYPEAIAKTACVVPDSLALEAILGAPFGGFMRTRSCPSTRSPPSGQPAHRPNCGNPESGLMRLAFLVFDPRRHAARRRGGHRPCHARPAA